MVKAGIAAVMALMLSACGLLPGATLDTFNLAAPARVSVSGSTSAQILVPESTSLAVLDTDRIVVYSGTRIAYYPEARWPDRLPKVIQARTIEAFETSGRASAAGRPGQGLSIDYQLLTDIRAFQYDTATGMVTIEIFAQIMDDRNGRIVATRRFTGSAAVAADTADAVVVGMNSAFQEVVVAIVSWTLGRI